MKPELITVANVTYHDLPAFRPLAADAGVRPRSTYLPLGASKGALTRVKR